MIEALAGVLLGTGSIAVLLGATGLLRFPDFFSRTHATSMTDTAGAGFILIGLMLLAGFSLVTVKLLMIWLFLVFTTPTAGHALAQAALVDGRRPQGRVEN